MAESKRILIKNIYYMLTYAFHILKQSHYDELETEEFENIQDLFAAILAKGIAQQLKQGLYREYITESDNLTVMRGKLEIHGTIQNKLQRKQLLFCEFDELSENNVFNQILKTTATILLRQPTVMKERRLALRKVLLFFGDIDEIDPAFIKWNHLRYERSNQSYRMLLNICFIVLDGLLLSMEAGQYKVATFLDKQSLPKLYEKFVLEYYRYHHPELRPESPHINWNVDDGSSDFLPLMKTDVTLKYGDNTLIIDTKFYELSMQGHYQSDTRTIHSAHLYQIFTYVKNLDVSETGNVTGLLLYAKTDETITPDGDYMMSGNKISVKTLDLNREFKHIATQLDDIAKRYLQRKS